MIVSKIFEKSFGKDHSDYEPGLINLALEYIKIGD